MAPTIHIVLSNFNNNKYGFTSCATGIVFNRKSKLYACAFICSGSFEIKTSSAPKFIASDPFDSEVVIITTCAPSALANFTPMCPNPPKPTLPTLSPLRMFQGLKGDQVVIPAHNKGATFSNGRLSG